MYELKIMTNVIFFKNWSNDNVKSLCSNRKILHVIQYIFMWNIKVLAPTIQKLLRVARLKFQIYRMTDSCKHRLLFYTKKNKFILQKVLRMYD